jgi:hypothetical protein
MRAMLITYRIGRFAMRTSISRTLIIAVVLGALAVLGVSVPANALPPQHTRVISACKHVKYKPGHYILACGDANAGLRHAKYAAWHLKRARGSGTYWFNDCTPNCASGKIRHQAATFRLYRPVATAKHGALFTRMLVTAHGKTHKYYLPKRTVIDNR